MIHPFEGIAFVDYAVLLLIVASVAVGVVASVVTTWSLRARLFSLQDTVVRMEGALLRETKARAGQERWKKPDSDAALLAALQSRPEPPKRKNWWETALPREVGSQKG